MLGNGRRRGQSMKVYRLTIREAATALAVSPSTIRRLIRSGVFRPVRLRKAGPGQRIYLLASEIEEFAVRGWTKRS